jgi:GT2 family glycosyltransferase
VDKNHLAYSAWASGGSAIFRKKIWDEIGGFNEVYSPGYWEDIDLGWTAWRMGYKILFDPCAKVEHQHESSFAKTDQNRLQLIKQRNELLFNWQHFLDREHTLSHLYFLITHTILHPGYVKVIVLAILKIHQLRKEIYLYTSAEILKKLHDKKELI